VYVDHAIQHDQQENEFVKLSTPNTVRPSALRRRPQSVDVGVTMRRKNVQFQPQPIILGTDEEIVKDRNTLDNKEDNNMDPQQTSTADNNVIRATGFASNNGDAAPTAINTTLPLPVVTPPTAQYVCSLRPGRVLKPVTTIPSNYLPTSTINMVMKFSPVPPRTPIPPRPQLPQRPQSWYAGRRVVMNQSGDGYCIASNTGDLMAMGVALGQQQRGRSLSGLALETGASSRTLTDYGRQQLTLLRNNSDSSSTDETPQRAVSVI
jgi:hypothetical protein